MRYCLTGDALINTNKGLVNIKDIVKDSALSSETFINMNILSLRNEINKASRFFNSGVHPIKEIKTDIGYSIKGSYNHPLLTLTKDENGKPIFYWKTLENIKVGDFVVIDRSPNKLESEHDLITEEEAKLLGGLVSEGYTSLQTNRIGFTNSNYTWIEDMKLMMSNIFKVNVCEYNREDNCKELCIHSKELINNWIEKYDLKDYSENKVIPTVVLKSSKKIQSLFLRYLFEGDGTIQLSKRDRADLRSRIDISIGYTSKSIKLLRQIQIVLLQFGIYCSILKDGDRDINRIRITGKQNIKSFYRNIGFAYETKQEKLEKAYEICRTEVGFISLGKDQIPFLKDYVGKTYPKIIDRLGFTNKQKFLKNKNRLSKILDKETMDFISNLHDLNYLYLPVSEISDLEPEVVYSIKVNSDCHSFVGNGFINHNTEAKLKPIAVEMLQYLDEQVVEFVPNFDDNEIEPTILPSLVPNLFLNGTDGIAVGVRTEIPPHNLIELTNAIIAYSKNRKISFEKILELMPAPDYPTGGIIVNKDDMLSLYSTGEGSVNIRSKIEVEQGDYGKTKLVITEIPYTQSGSKIKLIESIVDLAKNKKCEDISDIIDESKGDDEIRIVIELKKGSDIENVKNILYKESKIQDNQSCNFLVIDKQTPRRVNIKEYFELYLEFQEEILTKRYNLLLDKALKKLEIDVGLLMAIDQIDVIIEVIRGSKTIEDSKQCLMTGKLDKITLKTKKFEKVAKTFSFTEAQANAILALKLSRLINLESQKILEDKNLLEKNIANYNKILSDKKNLYKKIVENLKDMQKKYGRSRKTEITNSTIKVVKKAVRIEDLEILIDRFGYVKAVDPISIQKSADDTLASYKQNFTAKSNDKLYIFTKSGLLNQIKVKDIPRAKMKDKGTPIDVLGKLDPNDEILKIVPYESVKNKKILFVFDNGYVKKVEMSEYETNRQSIVATKLGEETIVGIKFISSEEKLTLISDKKQYKVDLVELPLSKKTVKGTKACNLTKGAKIKEFKVKEI